MFTESSKPTMAKKASAVADVIANTPGVTLSISTSRQVRRRVEHRPHADADDDQKPVSSMQVSTTLTFTDSPTPRKLISASSDQNAMPISPVAADEPRR